MGEGVDHGSNAETGAGGTAEEIPPSIEVIFMLAIFHKGQGVYGFDSGELLLDDVFRTAGDEIEGGANTTAGIPLGDRR